MHAFVQQPKGTKQTASTKSTIPTRYRLGQSPEVRSILHLQRTIGNQAVQRLLETNAGNNCEESNSAGSACPGRDVGRLPRPVSGVAIQTKVTANVPGDEYEQEADRVAEEVMEMPESAVRRTADGEEEESIQTKLRLREKKDEPAETEADDGGTVSADFEARLSRSKQSGSPLPNEMRRFMEKRMGHDFGTIKVHTDSHAVQMNEELGAQAFAHGKDIFFNKGKFDPSAATGKRLLAHELAHTVQQNALLNKVQLFRVTRVANVPSLAIQAYISTNLAGTWSHLANKMTERDRVIAGRLALVPSTSSEHAVLTRLQTRWPSFRTALARASTDPATWSLPASAAIAAARTNEQADRRALTGRSNRFVRASISQFLSALDAYLSTRARVDQERTEFHRFDPLINAADVITLLNGIAGPHFTRADLKALTGQETADFTNTRIHGISGTAGIRGPGRRNPGHIGVGQLTTAARNEAIAWASGQGVTIPARPDPRRIPAEAFKLAAAYMGRVSEILQRTLPRNRPSGDEYKKMVFAGYNGGPATVYRAARSFVGSTARNYTWADIRTQPTVTAQMRNYVRDIVARLT